MECVFRKKKEVNGHGARIHKKSLKSSAKLMSIKNPMDSA